MYFGHKREAITLHYVKCGVQGDYEVVAHVTEKLGILIIWAKKTRKE